MMRLVVLPAAAALLLTSVLRDDAGGYYATTTAEAFRIQYPLAFTIRSTLISDRPPHHRPYDRFEAPLAPLFATNRRRRGNRPDDDDDDDDDDGDEEVLSNDGVAAVPQLLPGSSSSNNLGSNHQPIPSEKKEKDTKKKTNGSSAVVGRKFALQYTCKICETRNTHMVSRLAYNKGLVIARCKTCQTRHIIADHLGWTDFKGTIEDRQYRDSGSNDASNNNTEVVSRVSKQVFDLERVVNRDTTSGSIVGEDGSPALE